MAEEDDETFPPEVQKLPTEFAFREFGRLPLITEENESILNIRSSLLTVANTYGLLFVGHSAGFKVFTDSSLFDAAKMEEECRPEPLVEVPLRSAPHWLAISSDNLTLVVCSSSEKGLQAFFFDTRNLINKAKPTKTPFCVYLLSKSTSDTVSSIHWNPSIENTQYLAICISSGAFCMLSLADDVTEVGRRPPEFGACSACWSPRGKQVMIGKQDGSMQQYTPTLEIRRAIPVYDAIERSVKVDDILWLSTFQVAFSYTPVSERDWQPSLFVVTLPSAKEPNKRPSWRNYEDPCYGMAQQRPSHFMMSFVDKWNLFVISSADASETAVIAKDKKSEVWEIWNLDDSCRAQLPMEESNDEPSPLGVALMYTASDRIVVDDTRECDPMPAFVMLSCDGHLSMFHMINLQSTDDYPNITIKPTVLSPEGERSPVVNKLGSFDLNKSAGDAAKLKLAAKAPVMASSTPVQPQPKPKLQESQLSTTLLHGGGLYDPTRAGTPKLTQRSLAFPEQSTPVVNSGIRESVQNQQNIPAKPPIASLDSKPMVKPLLGKTFSMAPLKTDAMSAPVPASSGVPFGVALPKTDRAPTPKRESSASSISASSTQPNSARRSSDTAKSDLMRKGAATISKEPTLEPSLSTHSSSSVFDGLVSEVADFEKELESFISESADISHLVGELGGNGKEEVVAMAEAVENLSEFSKGIAKTTIEQHEEIKTVCDLTLHSHAALQSVQTHRERIGNPAYRSALFVRPLDIADQRKMKEIRTLYHHIRETMKDVDMVLDDQWNKLMQKKSSSIHKSKRRLKMEEREAIRQALYNQTKILHNQEMNLLLLGQKLDKLRIFDTSLQFPYVDQPVHDKKEELGDSADLATLASSLIHRDKGDFVEQTDKIEIKSPAKANRISPKKAAQFSEFLALRKSAAIRTSFAKKSKFIAPSMPKSRSKEDQFTPEQSSQPSRFSSTSDYADESEESGVTGDSMRASERSQAYLPGYYFTNAESADTDKIVVHLNPGIPVQKVHKTVTGMSSVIPMQQTELEKPSFMRAPSPSSAQPTAMLGSSTITYGGPDQHNQHMKPVKKFDASVPLTEAASNLNNPPKVVNIKEFDDSQEINPLLAPKKFEAKPSVPAGVANEVQKVLDMVHAEKAQQNVSHVELSQPDSSRVDLSQRFVTHGKQSSFPSTETAKQTQPDIAHVKQASYPSATYPTATKSTETAFLSSMPSKPGLFSLGDGSNVFNQPSMTSQSSSQFSFTMKFPSHASSTNIVSESNLKTSSSGEQQLSREESAKKPQQPPTETSASVASAVQEISIKDIHESDAPPEGNFISSAQRSLAKSDLTALQLQDMKSSDQTLGIKAAAALIKRGNGECGIPSPDAAAFNELVTPRVHHSKEPLSETEFGEGDSEPDNTEPLATSLTASTPPEKSSPEAQKAEELKPESSAAQVESITKVNTSSTTTAQAADPPSSRGDETLASSSEPSGVTAPTTWCEPTSTEPASATSESKTDPDTASVSKSAFSLPGALDKPTFGTASVFGTVPVTTTSILPAKSLTFGSGSASVNVGESSFAALASTTITSFETKTTTAASFRFKTDATTTSPLVTTTSATNSVFGAPSATTSSASTTGSTFGAFPPTSSSAFGTLPASKASAAVTSSSSAFVAPVAGSVFGVPSATSSSVFGAPATSSVFGAPATTNGSVFGSSATTSSSTFGAGTGDAPIFGASAGFMSPPTASTSTGFGGGFLSGLGSTPAQSSANSNPFAAVTSVQSSDNNKSLFGNTATSPFSSAFGQSPGSSAFNTNNQSEGSKGFGSFIKPATGGFGGPPVFGSPAFGAKSSFGAAPSFGSPSSGFGSPAAFGSQQASTASSTPGFASAPSFGAFASSSVTGFGALAQQSGGTSGGFGAVAQQSGGFGAFAQQSGGSSGGFGAISQQSGGQASGFGAIGNQPSSGFGSSSFGSTPATKPSFSGWR